MQNASATVAAVEAAQSAAKLPSSVQKSEQPTKRVNEAAVKSDAPSKLDAEQVAGQKRKMADDEVGSAAVPPLKSKSAAADITIGEDAQDSDDDLVLPNKTVTTSSKIRKAQLVEEADDEEDHLSVDGSERLFSQGGTLHDAVWNARLAKDNLQIVLPEFGFAKKQTLAVQLRVPLNSQSWSMNITPADDRFGSDILMHFNPRFKKSVLILNDKQGTWGNGVKRDLGQNSITDGLRAREVSLMIQLRADGFYIFANNMYNAFFSHRRNPEQFDSLKVVFNCVDDNGNPQEVTINKVSVCCSVYPLSV